MARRKWVDSIRTIYGEDLDDPSAQHLLLREIARFEGMKLDARKQISDEVKDAFSHLVATDAAARAQQAELTESILKSSSEERRNSLNAYVRESDSIRRSFVDLRKSVGDAGPGVVQDAMQAMQRLLGPHRSEVDRYRAVWETILGNRTSSAYVSDADPASFSILDAAERQAGGKFDPEKFDPITTSHYFKMREAADLQLKAYNDQLKALDDQHALIEDARHASEEGSYARADRLIQQYAVQSKETNDKAWKGLSNEGAIAKRVGTQLKADPGYQELHDRAEAMWALAGQETDESKKMRDALAANLVKPGFQQWAKDNGLVVGNAKMSDGEVTEFNPGKDLMFAVGLAERQFAKRPSPGDKGPLIARKGARELVRVKTTDGDVILGKRLPQQASDEMGSMRISTAGGERYVAPSAIARSDVLKEKKRFNLGDEIRKSRGNLDQIRAAMALDALTKKPGMPDPASTELTDAPPTDVELFHEREAREKAEAAAYDAMVNPDDVPDSESDAMAALEETAATTDPPEGTLEDPAVPGERLAYARALAATLKDEKKPRKRKFGGPLWFKSPPAKQDSKVVSMADTIRDDRKKKRQQRRDDRKADKGR